MVYTYFMGKEIVKKLDSQEKPWKQNQSLKLKQF